MKAAALYELNSPFRVEEVSLDEPGDQEVLVKMVATGLCYSDAHYIHGDALLACLSYWDTTEPELWERWALA